MAPVLEDDVDLAGVEALPGDLLGERVRRDLVAHLLEQALGDGRRSPAAPTHSLIISLTSPLSPAPLQVAGAAAAALPLGAAEPAALAAAVALASATVGGGAEAPELFAQPVTTITTTAMPLSQRPILRSRMSVRSSSCRL